MNEVQASALCAALELGAPLAAPIPVTGGLVHHMWRLRTPRGDFAVKELSEAIVGRLGTREAYGLSEHIAAVMAGSGVPAAVALGATADGGPGVAPATPVRDVGGAAFLVYPWVDGATLPPGPAAPDRARRIGAILGRMHALRLEVPGVQPPAWETFRDDEWVLLARRGAAAELPWAGALRGLVPDLTLWNSRHRQVMSDLYRQLVVSHRDLDQKNVLWRGDADPVLIDWEAAGLINPMVELADAALNWSGLTVGEPDADIFAALLVGYRATAAMPAGEPRNALYAVLANWMSWLRHNLRRSLGEDVASVEERALGTHESVIALATLRRLAAGLDLYASWMSE